MIDRRMYEVRVIRAFDTHHVGDTAEVMAWRYEWLLKHGFIEERPQREKLSLKKVKK